MSNLNLSLTLVDVKFLKSKHTELIFGFKQCALFLGGNWFFRVFSQYFEDDPDSKIDDLHSTDDGEPCEEAHGAPNS